MLATDAAGDTTQQQYDAVDNTVAVTTANASGVVQGETRQYDPLNEVMTDTVSAPGSAAQTTHTYYDTAGRPVQVQQPNGDVVVTSYYFTGEPYQDYVYPGPVSAASGPSYEWTNYDGAGNVVERIDADGRDTVLTLDGADRVTQETDSSGGTTTLTTTLRYDPDGNEVSRALTALTGPGTTSTRTYTTSVNAADWTVATGDVPATGQALLTSYGYDGAGQQRTQTVLNGAGPLTTTLDAEGRATSLAEGVGGAGPYTTTLGYNPDDQPVTATLPNGVQLGQGYDAASRLITTTALGPTGVITPLNNQFGYSYNAAGWTTSLTTTVNGVITPTQLTHDALGRLLGASSPGSSQSWSYDGDGNLLTAVSNGVTTTYSYSSAVPNALQTYTTGGGTPVNYGYDQSGDTTSITSTAGLNTSLRYDTAARVTKVTLAEGTTVTLVYNAAGQRAAYTVGKGGSTSLSEQFTYRGEQLAQAVISDTQKYTDTYLYDQSGAPYELLRQTKSRGTLATARYWYVLDGRGSVVALTDVSGTVVDRYSYDLWGKLLSATESVMNPHRPSAGCSSGRIGAVSAGFTARCSGSTRRRARLANQVVPIEEAPGLQAELGAALGQRIDEALEGVGAAQLAEQFGEGRVAERVNHGIIPSS